METLLFSAAQLAARLTISTTTLSAMRRKGNGPKFVRVGGKVLYRAADVEAWLAEQACQSDADYYHRERVTAGEKSLARLILAH